MLYVIWLPPICGWVKCNVDGVALGSPWNSACDGIFRDHNVNHILNFSAFLGCETPENGELLGAIMAMEKAK